VIVVDDALPQHDAPVEKKYAAVQLLFYNVFELKAKKLSYILLINF
jgi:hypothetical protein